MLDIDLIWPFPHKVIYQMQILIRIIFRKKVLVSIPVVTDKSTSRICTMTIFDTNRYGCKPDISTSIVNTQGVNNLRKRKLSSSVNVELD